jgi:TetR/AcrR family transcriptional regulator, regulator of autoinduction and epiphytic fitness
MSDKQTKNREKNRSFTGLTAKSEAKTQAILQGAMQEFLAHGYAATSMDRIAKAAGVSKATVYSHFGDKEGLFNALIQNLVRDKFQTLIGLQKPQSLEKEPKLVLRELASKMLANVRSDRSLQDFMRIVIGESGRFPELAQAYVLNVAKPGIETLTQYFQSHPELKCRDSEATARIMVGTLVYFVILQEMLHGKEILPLENDRLITTLIDLITTSGSI